MVLENVEVKEEKKTHTQSFGCDFIGVKGFEFLVAMQPANAKLQMENDNRKLKLKITFRQKGKTIIATSAIVTLLLLFIAAKNHTNDNNENSIHAIG